MKNWRINLILVLIICFAALIMSRLIYIQVLNHQYWRALAQGQQRLFFVSQGERGEIFFQDGKKLATNQSYDLIYISPNEIADAEKTAEILSSILDLDKNSIFEKIKRDSFYEIIKKRLNQEEVEQLKEINLTGVYLTKVLKRYYPFKTLASQVIGFVGGDNRGQYGLESYYEDILAGKEKFLKKEKGPGGYLFSKITQFPENGSDIILTLDYNIQFQAERLLKENQENLDFEKGEIIVIAPESGKILALANFPTFDLNQYSKIDNMEIFKNSSIQKIFEPGSIFKAITMAAALDSGTLTPQDTYIDKGMVKIGGWTIRNYDKRVWGERSMTEVLEKSINTGAVFAVQETGYDIFLEYLKRFGIFEKTNVDLAGEVFSQNKEFQKGYEINFATASFGQGIEMTSLQLVRAFAAIANNGRLIRPYIMDKILENGKIIETQPEIQNTSVIQGSMASQLTMMLISTVENGFAKSAKIPGYYIAGKTGTGQIPWSALGINKSGYSDKTIQAFAGFAPAFSPQFLILVKLYNPKTRDASVSAVPIFRELAKYIIDYWQIPPDYDYE